jgi:hypothetical protein
MVESSSTTPLRETKKLKTPTPFSGKREDLQKFLQEVKIYLLANEDTYPNDMDKILFILSYMSEGDANSWKEEHCRAKSGRRQFCINPQNIQ